MAGTITLHVGQFKTGTTSIQSVLADQAEELKSRGILYPRLGRSTDHWLAVGGLFLRSQETLDTTFDYKRKQVIANAPRFESSWLEMREQMHTWPGDVVLSCESLAMARPSLVQVLQEEFPTSEFRVILGTRNPSKLISSWYQETAKRTRVVPFDDFVVNLLSGMLTQEPGPYDWMSVARVRQVWEQPGIDFQQVGNGQTGIATVIREILSAVGLDVSQTPPATNPAISRSAVAAWQQYLDQSRPQSMRLANTVRTRAFASAVSANDPRVGGSFGLHPDLAALVDQAFSPTDGEGTGAMADLRVYLGSGRPAITDGAVDSHEDLVQELAERLKRWDRVISPSLGTAVRLKSRLSGREWEPPDWSAINNGYV